MSCWRSWISTVVRKDQRQTMLRIFWKSWPTKCKHTYYCDQGIGWHFSCIWNAAAIRNKSWEITLFSRHQECPAEGHPEVYNYIPEGVWSTASVSVPQTLHWLRFISGKDYYCWLNLTSKFKASREDLLLSHVVVTSSLWQLSCLQVRDEQNVGMKLVRDGYCRNMMHLKIFIELLC